MRRFTIGRGVIALTAAGVLLASCATSAPDGDANPDAAREPITTPDGDAIPDAAREPITIGATMPLSGPLAALGQSAASGYELAVKDINAAGGINGRLLELTIKDDGADPAKAAQTVREFIQDDNVDLILGSYGSGASLAMSQEAERARKPNVMPFASNPAMVKRGYKWLTNMFPSVVDGERVVDDFLISEVKPQKATILYMDAPHTIAAAEASKANLEEAGVEVVLFVKFAGDTQDFTALVARAQSTGSDVVKFMSLAPQYIAFMPAMRQLGYEPDAVYQLQQIPFEPRTIDALGDTNDGVLGSPIWFEGLNPEYEARYKAEYGYVPTGHEAYQAYAAVEVIADALRRAGDTDAASVNEALRATNIKTVGGQFTFDDRGQAIWTLSVAQVQDGKAVSVWESDTSTGRFRLFNR